MVGVMRAADILTPESLPFSRELDRPSRFATSFQSRGGIVQRQSQHHRYCSDQHQHRRWLRCEANNRSLSLAKDFAATKIFRFGVQGAVFLVVLAAVDAAFSGDWSRVGVISKETESSLKPLVIGLGAFHIGCAVVAAKIAKEKELNVFPRVAKVLAVGFLALVETYLADGEED